MDRICWDRLAWLPARWPGDTESGPRDGATIAYCLSSAHRTASRHVCGIAEPFLQEKQNLKPKFRQTLSVDSLNFVMKVKKNPFYIEIGKLSSEENSIK